MAVMRLMKRGIRTRSGDATWTCSSTTTSAALLPLSLFVISASAALDISPHPRDISQQLLSFRSFLSRRRWRAQFRTFLPIDYTTGMRATNTTSQWLFPLSDIIHQTPSRTTSNTPVEQELYDRARGVEVLFRMGVSLALCVGSFSSWPVLGAHVRSCCRPISAMYTAATWYHRFYMRYAMEDYHRQVRGSAPEDRSVSQCGPRW